MPDLWTMYKMTNDGWRSPKDWGYKASDIGSLIAKHGSLVGSIDFYFAVQNITSSEANIGVYKAIAAISIDPSQLYFDDVDDARGLFATSYIFTLAPKTSDREKVSVMDGSASPTTSQGSTTVTNTTSWSLGANAGTFGDVPVVGVQGSVSSSQSNAHVIPDVSTILDTAVSIDRPNGKKWTFAMPSDVYWSKYVPPRNGVNQPVAITRSEIDLTCEVAFNVAKDYCDGEMSKKTTDGQTLGRFELDWTLECHFLHISSKAHYEEYAGTPGIIGRLITHGNLTSPLTEDVIKGSVSQSGTIAIPKLPPPQVPPKKD